MAKFAVRSPHTYDRSQFQGTRGSGPGCEVPLSPPFVSHLSTSPIHTVHTNPTTPHTAHTHVSDLGFVLLMPDSHTYFGVLLLGDNIPAPCRILLSSPTQHVSREICDWNADTPRMPGVLVSHDRLKRILTKLFGGLTSIVFRRATFSSCYFGECGLFVGTVGRHGFRRTVTVPFNRNADQIFVCVCPQPSMPF